MGIEFVSYFHGSKILAEENEAIYRALLYFNLPQDLIFKKRVRPSLGFQYPEGGEELKILVEDTEDSHENIFGKGGKAEKGQGHNVILMEVIPDSKGADKTPQIIGGYASHEWKGGNQVLGDESCFLFNLKQNLRFNARPEISFYQKTEISHLGEVE